MSKTEGSRVNLLIVSAEQELADHFMNNICGPIMEEPGLVRCGSLLAELVVLAGKPKENPKWLKSVAEAHALILLVEHADILSLEELKKISRTLPLNDAEGSPVSVVVIREPGKSEFKVSCLKCGQKLWVHDRHVGKTGKCPGCRRPLTIFSQKVSLRQTLRLPADLPVEQLDGTNHEETVGVINALIARTGLEQPEVPVDAAALSRATMRIQIDDPDLIDRV